MTDREKVIKGLKCCISMMRGKRVCDDCPYDEDFNCMGCAHVLWQAIALLKKHEKPDCEHAEHDSLGCLGYAGCTQDDEPIGVCKTCRKYTGNRYEEVNGDV